MKDRKWALISLLLFVLSFHIIRYPLFELHGMIQWPFFLFQTGMFVSIVATIFKNNPIPVCTTLGYIIGFILALLFNTDGVDPSGGSTNNLWRIWTDFMLVCMIVGIILTLLMKYIRRKI